MLWITLAAVYLAFGAIIGMVLEDRYFRRSSAGPRSLKDYVRSACTYAFYLADIVFLRQTAMTAALIKILSALR